LCCFSPNHKSKPGVAGLDLPTCALSITGARCCMCVCMSEGALCCLRVCMSGVHCVACVYVHVRQIVHWEFHKDFRRGRQSGHSDWNFRCFICTFLISFCRLTPLGVCRKADDNAGADLGRNFPDWANGKRCRR